MTNLYPYFSGTSRYIPGNQSVNTGSNNTASQNVYTSKPAEPTGMLSKFFLFCLY